MDELDVIDDSKVDDVFFIENKAHSIFDYLDGIQNVVTEMQETGDFEVGANTLRSMSSIGHAIGLSKAKLLHDMMAIWQKSGRLEDDFYQYVIDFGKMSNKVVIGRYIDAWAAFLRTPADFVEKMIIHPMKDLNALGAALSQGYEPDQDDWSALASAGTNGEFLKIIRQVKGKPAKKNSIMIYLEPNGDLIAWCSDERIYVGNLITPLEGEVILEKAQQRILKGASIIRK